MSSVIGITYTAAMPRPKKPEAEKLQQRSIRLTPAQWAKIDAAGLAALRKLLDRWRAPAKAP